jgi:glucose/arabinose dehydrogenase
MAKEFFNTLCNRLMLVAMVGLLITSLLPARPVRALSAYPPGFSEALVSGGLSQPIAMEFAPDGRLFITEKAGTVRIIKNGILLPKPFANLAVDSSAERGLLGVTIDPNFAINGYVYVHYISSPNDPGGSHGRVSRLSASAANPDVMEVGSEKYLIDDIPSPSGIHDGGEMHFGLDGKLYIAIGNGGFGNASSQNMGSLGGKMLRVNSDGSIPADNPYVNIPGTRPEIYASGFRNPFTFAVDSVTGRILVNDVGQDTWEEVNLLQKGGNYGWPSCEGVCNNSNYIDPIYTYNHNGSGKSVTGGAFYHGTAYPNSYQDKYFFGDYTAGFIRTLDQSSNTATDFGTSVLTPVNMKLGPDGLMYYVSIAAGKVFKIQYSANGGPSVPVGTGTGLYGNYFNGKDTSGTPALSRVDSTINFDWGTGSPAPVINNDQFSARWSGQVQAQYSEPYTFTVRADDGVRLTVNGQVVVDKYVDQPATDTSGTINLIAGQKYNIQLDYFESYGNAVSQLLWASPSQAKQIVPQTQLYASLPGTAPTANITSPDTALTYNAGDSVSYAATASDVEDGSLPPSAYAWTIVLHHAAHTHPFAGPIVGRTSGSFVIPPIGESSADTYYEIQLKVTDSSGQTVTTSRFIKPNTATITLDSTTPGISLTIDGRPQAAPYSAVGVTGFKRTIEAPLSQVVNGSNYNFVSWSDGGAASHEISTPAADTSYIATYAVGPVPSTPPASVGTVVSVYAAGTSAAGVYPTAQLLIDDQVVATYSDIHGDANARSFQKFVYASPVALTPAQVKVKYVNDDVINGEDRNLRVDKIMLNNLSYESEDPGVLSTGTWAAGSGCAAGNKQSEWLHCGGYFSYGTAVPPPLPPPSDSGTSTLKIYAAGTSALGVYPTMGLLIDGILTASFTNINGDAQNRQYKEYIYTSPTKLTVSQIKIQFANDEATATEDRNLRIDKIVLDGTEFQTEAASTNSTGTWSSDTGCAPGNKQSEWLHCNGTLSY